MAPRNNQPLVVIVGPTASGKTKVAIELAKKAKGEIICADSRTVYKEMDIGTAKPTLQEQREARHHLIDVVHPNQRFTASDFQQLAKRKIMEIRNRNKLPIMVGGTGLYVDSIIFDYKFGAQGSESLRKKLESKSLKELWEYCESNNIRLPENHYNKRYIIRAIEQKGVNNHKRNRIIDNCLVVGISTDKEELMGRIASRAESMFTDNLLKEAQRLSNNYGFDHESMTANIYKLAHDINSGSLSRDEALQKFITLDWRLAKRQITWLKRNNEIKWCERDSIAEQVMSWLKSRQAV